MANCIFCDIVAGKIPAKIVHDDEEVTAFVDNNPQAPVHILIVPKKHIATLNDLQAEDEQLIGRLFSTARLLAEENGVHERGYRLVINCNPEAGQSVFHIHLHLLGGRKMHWPPG